MYEVLTLNHKETKRFIRKNKLHPIHKKALKKNGGFFRAYCNGKFYFIEDTDLIRARFRKLNGE